MASSLAPSYLGMEVLGVRITDEMRCLAKWMSWKCSYKVAITQSLVLALDLETPYSKQRSRLYISLGLEMRFSSLEDSRGLESGCQAK